MKHKTTVKQTRKAESNVHPPGLIPEHPCKHFLLHNTNNVTLEEPTWTSKFFKLHCN